MVLYRNHDLDLNIKAAKRKRCSYRRIVGQKQTKGADKRAKYSCLELREVIARVAMLKAEKKVRRPSLISFGLFNEQNQKQ